MTSSSYGPHIVSVPGPPSFLAIYSCLSLSLGGQRSYVIYCAEGGGPGTKAATHTAINIYTHILDSALPTIDQYLISHVVHAFYFTLLFSSKQVVSVNFRPFFRNQTAPVKKEKFYTNYVNVDFPENIFTHSSDTISEVSLLEPVWSYN